MATATYLACTQTAGTSEQALLVAHCIVNITSLPGAFCLALAMLSSDAGWDKRSANQRRSAFPARDATPATKTGLSDGANVETSMWVPVSRRHRGNCCQEATAPTRSLKRRLVSSEKRCERLRVRRWELVKRGLGYSARAWGRSSSVSNRSSSMTLNGVLASKFRGSLVFSTVVSPENR